MLGRNSYTTDEVESCRANADALLAAWEANDVDDTTLENLVFAQAVVALDAWFAHRLRAMEGTDGNPMNEVRALADSLVGNDGTLRVANGIRWVPERTVLHLAVGDEVVIGADDFERLAGVYLAAIESTYVAPPG